MRSFDTSRRLFLGSFVSVLLLSCPQAFGQLGGQIKLYTDAAHTSSAWQDTEDLLYVYVVYDNIRESRGCTYRLRNCRHTMQHVEDINAHPIFAGNSQTGVDVRYFFCMASPILIQTVVYLGTGTSPPISSIQVVPNPNANSGTIEGIDCASQIVVPTVGCVCINCAGSGYSCESGAAFGGQPPPCDLAPLPVEETTWGQVKAIYRR